MSKVITIFFMAWFVSLYLHFHLHTKRTPKPTRARKSRKTGSGTTGETYTSGRRPRRGGRARPCSSSRASTRAAWTAAALTAADSSSTNTSGMHSSSMEWNGLPSSRRPRGPSARGPATNVQGRFSMVHLCCSLPQQLHARRFSCCSYCDLDRPAAA